MKYFNCCLFSFLALLTACSESQTEERVEIGKRYYLTDFPDSAYVVSMDSILKAEPLKKDTVDLRPNITLRTYQLPIASRTKKRAFQELKDLEKLDIPPQRPKRLLKKSNSESFAERFSSAMSKWQSDPNNKSLYISVTVKDGEDAFGVLIRTYGKDARQLPRFYTLSVLQSLNPGVAVEHPESGQTLRLPRL